MWVGGGRLHEAEGQAWRCPSTWAPLQGVLRRAAKAGHAEASLAWPPGRLPSCLPPMLLPNKPECLHPKPPTGTGACGGLRNLHLFTFLMLLSISAQFPLGPNVPFPAALNLSFSNSQTALRPGQATLLPPWFRGQSPGGHLLSPPRDPPGFEVTALTGFCRYLCCEGLCSTQLGAL